MSARDGRPAAIVTGGSSGIGRALVLELAARGYDVGFTYRARARAAEELCAEVELLGGRVLAEQLQLPLDDDGPQAIERLIEALGGVDAFVNNAATNTRGSVLDQSLEEWRRTLEVNLTAPFACAQTVARAMVAQRRGGSIVNVTSVLQEAPLPDGAAYCASKAGLGMVTRVLALELAEHGIRVNSVAPGHTITPMNYAAPPADDDETRWPAIPLGRSAAPEEVARTVAFLCGPEASYATGGTLLVDGGLLLVAGPGMLQEATGLPPAEVVR